MWGHVPTSAVTRMIDIMELGWQSQWADGEIDGDDDSTYPMVTGGGDMFMNTQT